jgi:Fic family protein
VRSVLAKARFWEQHARLALNARQRLLLDGFVGKLTSAKWTAIAKCSPDTALCDTQPLRTQGLLRKELTGGRSSSYRLAHEVPS